ncbi:MAG: hypothetical protein CM15mP38_0030 [Synechococcus sp.]|nr:MAG: hypothetical protein CM15mP38_0030 [Synechococcus sp.]
MSPDVAPPANLYVGLVGPSGLTKSPIQKALISDPTRQLQAEEKARFDRLLKEWEDADPQDRDKHLPAGARCIRTSSPRRRSRCGCSSMSRLASVSC